MRKMLATILLFFVFLGASAGCALAQIYLWRYQTHATDCTSLSTGKPRDLCFEEDDNTLYKCETGDGDCDTAGEWTLIETSDIDFDNIADSMTLDGANLTIGIGTSDINIGSDTFFIDGSTSRVGIGTSTPATALDVVGTVDADEFTESGSTTLTNDISGNSATSTALAANGSNCSAGNAPLGVDASGAVEGCFDVWTESENTSAAYISNVVEDTTPQLGGNLDAQGNNFTDVGDIVFKTGATGGTLQTGTSNADKYQIQAYDVDDGVYRTLLEADAGNTVQLQVFADYFHFEDVADSTKILDIDLSGATTGTTTTLTSSQTVNRVVTLPDATDTLVGKATTDTFTNKTFDANGTGNAITNIETADLASAAKTGLDTAVVTGTAGSSGNCAEWNGDGDLIDSGASCGGGSSEWTDTGTTVHPSELTDEIGIGTSVATDKLEVVGDADQVQFSVKGHSTQTSNLAEFKNNADTVVFSIANDGSIAVGTSAGSEFIDIDNQGEIRLQEATINGDHYSGWRAAASTTQNSIRTLPADFCGAGEVLVDNGSGTLSCAANSGSGDITDVFDCSTGDCNSITLADGDLLSMSSVSVNTTGEGFILPQHATDCSSATAEGQVCWEVDDDVLYIGDGTTAQSQSGGTGDVTAVGNCTTGACFTGSSGTTLSSNTDLIFALDEDNDGTESFQILDGADATVVEILESGLITTLVGLDAIGAVDMDYGSADVTDHTFTTDGTGDSEIVLPNDSIGPAELDSTTGSYDFGGVDDLEIPNGASPTVDTSGQIAVDTTDDQLVFYGSAKRVISYTDTKCITVENLAAADDDLYFWSPDDNVTLLNGWCHCSGTCTTEADISLETRQVGTASTVDAVTGTITCEDEVTGDSKTALSGDGATVDALDIVRTNVDNAVSPETDTYQICVEYSKDAQ